MVDKRSSGRPSGKDSTKVRDAYIKAARIQFTENGYLNASMSTIAKDAGYTPTALRHHFPNKVELYSAVFAATANE
ncbi:MAG: TetR/AcrR family transcriptional regulator, partial [Acidimicrobiales bacterium]